MIRFRYVLACAAAAAVTGCSTVQPGTAAPAQPAAPTAAAPSSASAAAPSAAAPTAGVPTVVADEAGVRTIFKAYYAALGGRDFDSACAMNAPETNEALLANAAKGGLHASTCSEALTRIYAVPGASAAADQIVTSAEVDSVAVKGDEATITWSAQSNGGRQSVTSEMRLVDGQWRLVDTGAR